jgi:hypothetical protein
MLEFIITLALILVFIWVFVDDIRKRSVHVLSFVLIFSLSILCNVDNKRLSTDLFLDLVFNLLFVAVLSIFILGYLSVRYKAHPIEFRRYIGAGDLLFWIAITPLFPMAGFVPHFVASLVSTLILHWFFCLLPFYKGTTVPLAGIQGLYFAFVCTYQLSLSIYEN